MGGSSAGFVHSLSVKSFAGNGCIGVCNIETGLRLLQRLWCWEIGAEGFGSVCDFV